MFACARRQGVAGLALARISVHSAGGFENGFEVSVCRACADPPCARVCPTDALLVREGGGVKLRPDLCIGCQSCQQACPFNAIFWDAAVNKPLICLYCGYCVDFCLYDVIRLEEIEESQHASRS
jgi:carbon-monoxide dehydrogenase iron sulfur subunit